MERNNSPNYFFLIAIVAIVAVAGILVMIMQPSTQTSDLAGQGAKLQLGGGGETNAPVPLSEGKLSSYYDITTCGRTITKPGTYTLKNDLTCSGDGIIVDVNPSQYPDGIVYINGNGKSITGAYDGVSSDGIMISSGKVAIQNIQIANFDVGVSLHYTSTAKATINSGIFSECREGIYVGSSAELTINGGEFINNGVGVMSYGKLSVYGGDFSNNEHDGLSSYGKTIVYDGNFENNYYAGIVVSDDGMYEQEFFLYDGFFSNSRFGVTIGGQATINGGIFEENGDADIYLQYSESILHLDGGVMCDAGMYNIIAYDGTITGDEDNTRAKCRIVNPEEAYDCLPCDQIR